MLLTSYERARRFLCVEDNADNRRVINGYLYGVSAQLEGYIGREFEKISRTEYFDVQLGDRQFYMKAIPVTTITTVKVDPTGEFTGSETPLSNSFTGREGLAVVLQYQQIPAIRGLQVVYTGGVATSTSISTYTLSTVVGSLSVDQFLEGQTSGAFGIIKSWNSVSKVITVDVLYGTFLETETVKIRATEDAGLSAGISAILATVDDASFVEVFPEVAIATEMQLRYNVKTKDDFENQTVEQDKVRRRDTKNLYMLASAGRYVDLQPECRSMVNKLRRYTHQ